MGDQLAQWAHLPGQTGAQTESFPGYNDWARIDWNNSVRLGPNRFSGDALVAPSELRLGEKVCIYGQTTRRENCGRFMGNMNFQIFVDGLEINSGNSGGPLWVEDRGLVGVLTGKDARYIAATTISLSTPQRLSPEPMGKIMRRLQISA